MLYLLLQIVTKDENEQSVKGGRKSPELRRLCASWHVVVVTNLEALQTLCLEVFIEVSSHRHN